MGRGEQGDRSVLDVVLDQWPTLIFLPAILVLVGVLVGVTRWWDRRDGMLVTAGTTRDAWWRRFRREPRCTCSWHTMSAEMGAGSG